MVTYKPVGVDENGNFPPRVSAAQNTIPRVFSPSGFPVFVHLPMPKILRLGGQRFRADLDLSSLMPSGTGIWWVSPAGVGAGTSKSVPAKVSVAIAAAADGDTIMYLPGEYRREQCALSGAIEKSLKHLAAGPGVRLTGWNSSLVWTLTSGHIYQTTRSSALLIVDILNRTAWGDFTIYTQVADLASLTAAGQFAIVGSVVYVWPIGNTDLSVGSNSDNQLRMAINVRTGVLADTATVQYARGIDFEGSANGGFTGSGGAILLGEECTFRYNPTGASGGNGVNITNAFSVLTRCTSSSNMLDGYNYHDTAAFGTEFIEIDCKSHHNGLLNPGTNNSSTSHDDCKGIRVNGVYDVSGGPVIADVNSAKTWNLGCDSGDSTLANSGSYACDAGGYSSDPATMWLDECNAREADYAFRTYTEPTTTIHTHACTRSNVGAMYPTDTGTVDWYTP